jgi:endonuclease-3
LVSNRKRMRRIIELMEEHYGKKDETLDGNNDPFRTLIGCVLSQRTRDENAGRAARNLFKDVGFPRDILRLSPEEIKDRIRCSGFYNQKAKNILAICMTLEKDYGGMVPNDRSKLICLPGVGPKTADIVLSYAFDKPAIAIDVHVANVAKSLGLVNKTAKPEKVKETLEDLVPPHCYRFVDVTFVRHGKEYCRSRNSRCSECFLNEVCEQTNHIEDR